MILFLGTNIVIYAIESHTTWGVPAQTRIATLEEAGCHDPGILAHRRQPGEHVRGCWVVGLILGKE